MAAYLADATIPLRLACRTPAGGLWMLSLWHRFDADAERLLDSDRDEVVIELDPQRCYSWDFTEWMRDVSVDE